MLDDDLEAEDVDAAAVAILWEGDSDYLDAKDDKDNEEQGVPRLVVKADLVSKFSTLDITPLNSNPTKAYRNIVRTKVPWSSGFLSLTCGQNFAGGLKAVDNTIDLMQTNIGIGPPRWVCLWACTRKEAKKRVTHHQVTRLNGASLARRDTSIPRWIGLKIDEGVGG
ncbi:hypothetical protein DFH07DRAFT_770964 [Mycena maculata]|uniref:Uncharacterized protein n=1 Tax=Mycena maculata TaxID=230809 RepID=A0AAD7JDZ4_9AGAR|nr:hypothetical protein DFH07DRAFT_770964 [Mycena maculata]